jgi:hypothetical protein
VPAATGSGWRAQSADADVDELDDDVSVLDDVDVPDAPDEVPDDDDVEDDVDDDDEPGDLPRLSVL